jgi:hypothetical protein
MNNLKPMRGDPEIGNCKLFSTTSKNEKCLLPMGEGFEISDSGSIDIKVEKARY